jgi:CheY-like chemotaxis protein
VLGLPCPPPGAGGGVLLLEGRDGVAAVAVDDGFAAHTIVRRPLPEHLGSVACVQGATLLEGRLPVLLLDPLELADACRGAPPAGAAPADPVRRRVLVADDSETVRRGVAAELERAGWDVATAADGQHALEHLAAGAYDAVVSDVQMPRRDGFAVAQACAGRTPCLLMTSAASPAVEARARALGADFLAKDAALPARVLAALSRLLPASPGAVP